MRSRRRLCALAVLSALLAALPLGAPRGCPECPPGCPMHQQRPLEGSPAARRPGCHRGAPIPAGTVCLRSACGHHPSTEAPATLAVVLPGPVRVDPLRAVTRLVSVEACLASLPSPDPPTDPPRAVHI